MSWRITAASKRVDAGRSLLSYIGRGLLSYIDRLMCVTYRSIEKSIIFTLVVVLGGIAVIVATGNIIGL